MLKLKTGLYRLQSSVGFFLFLFPKAMEKIPDISFASHQKVKIKKLKQIKTRFSKSKLLLK